jgi:hypothetical protein
MHHARRRIGKSTLQAGGLRYYAKENLTKDSPSKIWIRHLAPEAHPNHAHVITFDVLASPIGFTLEDHEDVPAWGWREGAEFRSWAIAFVFVADIVDGLNSDPFVAARTGFGIKKGLHDLFAVLPFK